MAEIGPLEAAARIAGSIKTVLVLQRELASLNPELQMLNPTVAVLVDGCAIHFPVELESLQRNDCISSFGFYS